MKITTFEELVKQINSDLGQFCKDFAYKRKELARLGRTPRQSILFDYDKGHPEWAINEGGGTEIQYQIDFHNETIRFGLGFNANYVPFHNDCSPVDYIKPFVNAYFELKNTALVSSLKSNGYEFIIGSEEELRNIQVGQYYLFGKKIAITNNEISDEDYRVMIEDIKGPLYKLYCAIFERKNENERNSQRRSEEMQKIQNYVNLLLNSRNIILHGAPGTGKTYLARQIAESMGAETCFVQFHPSYDYTDFVEGLRPIKTEDSDESSEIGFERKDGVFKDFCQTALDNCNKSKKTLNELEQEQSLNSKITSCLNDLIINREEIPLTGGSKFVIYDIDTKGRIFFENITKGFKVKEKGKIDKLITLYIEQDKIKIASDVTSFVHKAGKGKIEPVSRQVDYYYFGVLQKIKDLIDSKAVSVQPTNEIENENKKKNFVFIIDEINRGEMSKIFGELFFSIDPGYRGEKGKISTQYQNLVDEDDAFYDGFYVPENVYIIGTMNDIDRNVESMDFAIRRRFAFREITAAETKGMLDNPESWNGKKPSDQIIEALKNRMTNLNNAISGIDGLSSAYHIGAAYFLKYDSSFDELWNYHLKPLLQEYLRGMEGAEQKLKDLEAAYKDEEDHKEQ